MKKLLVLILTAACAVCLAFGAVGCNPEDGSVVNENQTAQGGQDGVSGGSGNGSEGSENGSGGQVGHKHNYIYKCNQTEHWQACNICGEEKTHATHGVSDGVCETCGYVEKCTAGLEFTAIKEGGVTVAYSVSKGTATDSEIFIPSFHENLPVSEINSHAFRDCTSFTSIIIGSGVTSIGDGAFLGCSSLISVTIGSGVTSIGDGAFAGCSILAVIEIPDSVTSIGERAFLGCTSLASITIPDSVISIGDWAFQNCASLTSIQIPDDVTSIGERAFYGCYNLTSITIGNGVTSIGNYTFSGCTNLTSITIPDCVTSIGERAFVDCISLTNITIGIGVISIGDQAFSGCIKLVEVINLSGLPIVKGASTYGGIASYALNVANSPEQSKIRYSQDYVYYEDGDIVYLLDYTGSSTTLQLPDKLGEKPYGIYDNAFYLNEELTEVTIPDGVTSIGERTFCECTSLINITIGKGVTSIGHQAFLDCQSLTSITIPNSVTTIGNWAFGGCSSLINITIGKGVTSIGEMAFGECNKLIEVINLSGLPIEKGEDTYGGIASYALNVVNSPEQSKIRYSQDYVYYEDGNTVYLVGYRGSDTKLQLPDKLGEKTYGIYDYAFYLNKELTEVTIPDSVTSIGNWAFGVCSNLISITIGNGVTSIGDRAFSGCNHLTTITISNSVTSIGDQAFQNCENLERVIFNNPDGWYCTDDPSAASRTDIPCEDLQNPATAAQYLKYTYIYYHWHRETA